MCPLIRGNRVRFLKPMPFIQYCILPSSLFFPEYQSVRDQFEFESFYLRSAVDHTPSDMRDMTLNKGSLLRVVNSALYPDAWLAWSVDESTGTDMELRRIPTPKR